MVGCGSRNSRGLAVVFLGLPSAIAPVIVHAVARVVEVTQLALRGLSRILSLRCGGCDH